jgi:hypothetical protein
MMDDFDKECPRCHGQGIAPPPAVVPPQPAPQSTPAPPPSINTSTNSSLTPLVTTAAFLIFIALSLAYMANKANNEQDDYARGIEVKKTMTDADIRADYEETVKSGLNEKLASKGAPFTCVEVSLVKETERKYSGFARFSDGDTTKVEVLVDEDGRTIWRSGG